MTQKLAVLTDINGVPTGGLNFPIDDSMTYNTLLAANVAQSITVPPNCNRALFTFTPLGCWVNLDQAAITVPGGSFANTAAVKDPIDRAVVSGQTLRFISTNNTEVGIEFLTTKQWQ